MNPYIKSPGSTDIMSESDKKTPIVPSDQGATSMTATVVPKELESEWLQFLKQKEEDKEHHEMEVYYNTLVENMQKHNPVRLDPGPTPNIQNYSLVAALKKSETKTVNILPAVSVLRIIGNHVSEVRQVIADTRDGNSTNTLVEGKVEALAKYLGGLPTTEVAAHQIEDSDKKGEVQ